MISSFAIFIRYFISDLELPDLGVHNKCLLPDLGVHIKCFILGLGVSIKYLIPDLNLHPISDLEVLFTYILAFNKFKIPDFDVLTKLHHI